MTLIKTSLLNGIAVIIKILSSLILNKVLAIYVGPAGYAAIGQLQNFVNTLTTFANGGVSTGVTKLTAEHFDDFSKQVSIWKSAVFIVLFCSVASGAAILLLREYLALLILKDVYFSKVFLWLGFSLVFFSLNSFLMAVLNGKKEVKTYVVVNIAGSVVGLLVTSGLAFTYGLYGALIALTINQSIVLGVTLVLCRRTAWFGLSNFVGRVDPTALSALGKFVLMALTSAICIPLSQMLIRNHLGTAYGWQAAGHWEALMRISNLYLMVVTTPLTVYYLPRLSEIRKNQEIRREVSRGFRIVLPVAAAGAFIIYVLRDWIVVTLFTADFLPMRELFGWQMIGDTVKISSWLLGYVLLSRAMVGAFIATEVFFSVSWVALVWIFTRQYGEQGAQIGYLISYLAHALVMMLLVMKKTRVDIYAN